jgi:CRISPR-associated protein Cst1
MALFAWTGNPWVDSGIAAIAQLTGKTYPEDIDHNDLNQAMKVLSDVYVTPGWVKSLYSVFPNNVVTNPIVKDKRNKLSEFLTELYRSITPLGEEGDCIACGRRNTLAKKSRMHVPLTGYVGSHYFSFQSDGADYCDACTFAIQCFPLLCYACGKLLLIHSDSTKVMRYWARRCLAAVNTQIAIRNFTGCFNEDYTQPQNALFHVIQDIVLSYDERWSAENASVRAYHFTNYNQGPDLDIYDLPSVVFSFLAYVRSHDRYSDWIRIIRKGYKKIEGKSPDDYKNYKNAVYQALLEDRSITGYFLDSSKHMAIGDWNLLAYYLTEVRRMNDSRVNAIKLLGDNISNLIRNSQNGKKRLGQIERTSNYASFRNVLLRLARDSVLSNGQKPLVLFDDYVKHLFPEGAQGWRETQDLLLFRLYENLHDWLLMEGLAFEELDDADDIELNQTDPKEE